MLLTAAKGFSSVVQNKLLEVMGSNQLQNVTVDSFDVVKGKVYLFFSRIEKLDRNLMIFIWESETLQRSLLLLLFSKVNTAFSILTM